ncbi:unnamed protein product [Durusdinium trenchii]|uniref:Reverse transcriptase RNase H-like domain-containing protein n=1 Tax=Durusdinium trenchii TaxID=1381693 RepID=A0ABP0STU9_9DINO
MAETSSKGGKYLSYRGSKERCKRVMEWISQITDEEALRRHEKNKKVYAKVKDSKDKDACMRKGSFSLRLDDFDSEEPLEDQITVNFELLKQWFELMGRETPMGHEIQAAILEKNEVFRFLYTTKPKYQKVEAYEAALDWRGLVADFLVTERRSGGVRRGPHESRISELKEIVRRVSGPREKKRDRSSRGSASRDGMEDSQAMSGGVSTPLSSMCSSEQLIKERLENMTDDADMPAKEEFKNQETQPYKPEHFQAFFGWRMTLGPDFFNLQVMPRIVRHTELLDHVGKSSWLDQQVIYAHLENWDSMMRLLGWKVAEDKGVPFASSLACLGVKIDLEHFAFGCVTISNTPERKRELAETVRKVLQDGKLSLTSAQSLRGRMQFAENQFMGRMARRALAAVTEHSVLGRLDVSFSLRCHLEDFLGELLEGPPRTLKTFTRDTLFLFTDACFEPDRSDPVGIGCVLVGTEGRPLEFIAGSPQLSVCEFLGLGAKKTIIFEAEMYALLVGLKVWGEKFANRQLVVYVDNDAVRGSIANSYERLGAAGMMLERINSIESSRQFLMWVARVPSKSNVADGPSRGDYAALEDAGAFRVQCLLDFAPFQREELNGGVAVPR